MYFRWNRNHLILWQERITSDVIYRKRNILALYKFFNEITQINNSVKEHLFSKAPQGDRIPLETNL